MELSQAAKLLGVELPTTKNHVKRAYHVRSLQEHPDHSKAKDAAQRFNALTEAYKALSNLAVDQLLDTDDAICDDGTHTSKLGKGLGPTVNGQTCPECKGHGFNSAIAEMTVCECYGAFKVKLPCAKCARSGIFKVNGVVKGRCFACQGLGYIFIRCPKCNGSGIKAASGKLIYYKCGKCKGCGELPMWNPVLPKGLLL